MADSRAYEIQLVETLRSIGRALGASGISSGGSSSSSSPSTNLGDVVTALNGVNSRLDTVKFYLDNLAEKVTYDQDNDSWHIIGNLYADGFITAGGAGGGGDEPGYLSEMWISLKGNSDSFANEKINPYHIPIGDGLAIDTSTNPYTIKVVSQGTVTAVAIGSGSPISPVNGVITLPAASSISASEQGLVKGSLLYSVLGDAFDSSNSVKDFVNSSIATATATYRGSYNVVSDLGGHYDDSEATIAAALATKMASLDPPIVPDNNDYCYVPIPTSDSTPTQIARVDRYKYNDDDEEWAYEYTLNNSGYTAAQWAAINSGVNSSVVSTVGTLNGYFSSGKLSVTHGGTGLSSINEYSLIYASATNTFSALAPNTSSTKKFLSMTGVAGSGNTPAWSTVSVTDVIGTTAIGSDSLPVYYSGSAFSEITSLDLLSKNPGVVKAKKFYLDAETYFELDSNNNVKLVVRSGKGFYTEGFVTAGGVGSGGGGGGSTNLLDVWTSMQNTNTDTDYNNWKIHKNHLPDITANNGLSAQYGTHSGTGQSMTSTLSIGIASGYKLPTTTEWGNKADASALAGYLPLTAGSSYPLTGTLYAKGDLHLYKNNSANYAYIRNSDRTNNTAYLSIGTTTGYNTEVNAIFIYDGKVGINKSTEPGYTLDVNGTLNATSIYENGTALSSAYLPVGGGTIKGYIHFSDGSGNAVGDIGKVSQNVNHMYILSDTTLRLGGGGVTDVVITATHEIGLGTTNPSSSYKVDVGGALNATTLYQNGTAIGNTYLPLVGGTLTGALTISTAAWGQQLIINRTTGSSSPSIIFQTSGSEVGSLYYYYDYNDFYFGIGGNNYQVHHSGNSNLSTVPWECSTLTASGNVITKGVYKLWKTNGSNYAYIKQDDYASNISRLTIGTCTGYNTEIDAVSILNGKAGIGTNAPGERLHIKDGRVAIQATEADVLFENASGTLLGYIGKASLNNNDMYFIASYSNNVRIGSGQADFFIDTAHNVGIGKTSGVNYKLDVDGVINASTGVRSPGYGVFAASASSSDAKLKDGIVSISPERAWSVLMQLKPREWTWNSNYYQAGKRGAGLVAQEVEPVLPFSVLNEDKYLHLNYNVLHGFEIAGLQDHETRLEQAEKRIAVLEAENAELKARLNN